jgi:hypothetical protein
VIKFVSDLRQVGAFSPVTTVSSTNKTDCQDITEILLKVVLNTITIIPYIYRNLNFEKDHQLTPVISITLYCLNFRKYGFIVKIFEKVTKGVK